MLRSILLLSLLAACVAIHTGSPVAVTQKIEQPKLALSSQSRALPPLREQAAPLAALRGGSPLGADTDQKLLYFSAVYVSTLGILAAFAPDVYEKVCFGWKVPRGAEQVLGAALVGWGVGKFVAAKNNNVKEFSQINLIPSIAMALAVYKDGHQLMTAGVGLFVLMYLYLGFA